jgi:hypothetical protein
MKMSNYKRQTIGSVYKSRDPTKSNYIKIKDNIEPVTLTPGSFIQVESKAFQLASLAAALEKGVLSEENAAKAEERINKIPDFVLAELIYVKK